MTREDTGSLAAGFPEPHVETWRTLAERAIGRGGLDALRRRTLDGIEIEPLYAPPLGNALPDTPPRGGWPGAWEVAQPHRHPDPERAATEAREDLEEGAGSVVIRLDRSLARGVERPDGVAAYDRGALERLLSPLAIEGTRVRIEAGEWALERLADLEAIVRERGGAGAPSWHVFADPLSAALEGAGGDPLPRIEASLAALGGSTGLLLAADGRPWYEAGASEVQEAAAVLASALLWLRTAERLEVPLETVLPRLELVLAVDADLFASLAKLRATRLVLERISRAAGIEDRAGAVRIRAVTGERTLSRLDPWVNILRTTMGAVAGVTGGADAVTVVPFDRPLGEASALARRIARNIQLVLREEAGLGRVRDPGAGSWYVAHLTRSLAEAIWARLQALEAQGGLLAQLATGAPQREIEETARIRARRLATGEDQLVGVSAFPTLQEKEPPEGPGEFDAAVARAREILARGPQVREPQPFPPLRPVRLAEPFEQLRARAEAAHRRDGHRPTILVLGSGRAGELHELATRVENLLAAGGIAVERLTVATPEEAAQAAGRARAGLAILAVGASAAGRAAGFAAALRTAGVERLWLAGAAEPWPEGVEALDARVDLPAWLAALHDRLGTPEPARRDTR